MHYNLIVNYYVDKNQSRSQELDACILENIKNPMFNTLVVIGSDEHLKRLLDICPICPNDCSKLIPMVLDKRPSYNDYFAIISKLFCEQDNISVVSNLDIIIPAETLIYSSLYLIGKSCLALTRWDISSVSNTNSAVFFNRPDSQDTWIFKGAVPQIAGATFTLGLAGCDNSIAHLLEKSGYEVKNPSLSLKTYHLHNTNIRNYTNVSGIAIERIQPPYKLLPPTR